MNRDQVEGKVNELTGKAKQKLGGLTNDPALQDEGADQEMDGKAQKTVGKAKESIGKAVESVGQAAKDLGRQIKK